MSTAQGRYPALDKALWLDAAATGAMGALLLLDAGVIDGLIGIPALALRWAGGVLVPYAGLLVWAARQPRAPRLVLWLVVGGNIAWSVASVLLVLGGWLAPTSLGTGLVLAQAVVVALFAVLEYQGMRGGTPTLPSAARR